MARTPLKGLREIRTISGKQDQTYRPYRAYMQITCLEMEKARRRNERKTALQRITALDARLQEIEAEKQTLLRKVQDGDLKHLPRGNPDGFRIRY